MQVVRTYKVNENDALSLCLVVDFKNGNKLFTSFPMEFLRTYFPKAIEEVQFAYLPSQELAFELLDELAKLIKRLNDSNLFYYPEYILCDGQISYESLNDILNGMQKMKVWPRTHYCRFSRPVDFFILNGFYLAERHLYESTMRDMAIVDFRDYLMSSEMKLDYNRLHQRECKAYVVIEGGEIRYALLVSASEELLMVISI